MGTHKKSKICINMENSLEFIIATIACLRMCCICIPVSTETPIRRIVDIINDCDAHVILVDEPNKIELLSAEISNLLVLSIDSEDLLMSSKDAEHFNTKEVIEPPLLFALDDIVYILYTSGSTGKPKGVEIFYKGLINYVDETLKCLKIKKDSRILITNPFSFDASFGYIYCALKAEAEIIIYNSKLVNAKISII